MPTKNKQEETAEVNSEIYIPTPTEKKELKFIYKEVEEMITERNRSWRQFNDRTLLQFIDDSEKRVQGYVPTREEQGKEDWQSNVFSQATRNKLKALVAAVANTPPDLHYKAVNLDDGGLDLRRAGVIGSLVMYSRNKTNPETEIFWEAWNCATQGTVIEYDGYLKTKYKRKFIKSYDLITGEMEFDEKEVEVADECINVQVPISEFFIKDFHIHDVQDQPAVAWIRYLDKDVCEQEFGQYKNWSKVLEKSKVGNYQSETETFFYNKWKGRVEGENDYEVIKYYNRFKDKYCIVINGVLILTAPMLWGRKDKMYPFAKSIFEPFSGKDFFYGNSLPNANMDVQDVINSLYNMGLDKTYRSLAPPRLAGIANKDLLEMENERIGMDTTIYVQDVNQVKYQAIPGMTQSEMAMIQWVGQQLDLGTVDTRQQGVAGTGRDITAREIVIANEHAKKLKGVFFMFLTDLWIQKTKLRIPNILTNYTQPKLEEIVGLKGKKIIKESFKTFLVEGSEFPDGSTGTLAIQIVGNRDEQNELDIEEEKMKLQGENYQKLVMTSDYLDNYDYDVQVIPESLHLKDSAEAQAVIQEKIRTIMIAFPQIFMANQDLFFEDLIKAYRDDLSRYNMTPSVPMAAEGGEGITKKGKEEKPVGGEKGLPALPPI